jgi:hypothetical protein
MFRHVFLYKVAPGADPQTTVDILQALPAKVPGIRNWTLGQHQAPAGKSAGRWDYGLVCDFDGFAELQAYNGHSSHLEAVKTLLPMLAAHAICDFEFDPEKQKVS